MNMDTILRDCNRAKEKLRLFEFPYRALRPEDLAYLREQSAAYKRAVLAVQELILPAVNRHCPSCAQICCRLHAPEHQVYIAGTVGCFQLVDYLLVRCDTDLPVPDFDRTGQNLCAFWDNGCPLRPDCRSLTCLQWFCEPIRQDLDMEAVNERIVAVKTIVDRFSLRQLLKK